MISEKELSKLVFIKISGCEKKMARAAKWSIIIPAIPIPVIAFSIFCIWFPGLFAEWVVAACVLALASVMGYGIRGVLDRRKVIVPTADSFEEALMALALKESYEANSKKEKKNG